MDNAQTRNDDKGAIGAMGATLGAFNDSFVKALERNRSVMEKMLLAMQEESLRFVNLRMEHTSKAIRSARDCHGLTGLIGVQHEWLVDAARDYAQEGRRFGDAMRVIAAEGANGLAQSAQAGAENAQAARGHASA
ncbi:MAG TPA: hypothetical protein VHC42_07075 [Rhizomicrobium sp.]|nr:hypothetical protein [Rhizomicrobium sp.]